MSAFDLAQAEWMVSCEGRRQIAPRITPGLYVVHWVSGGSSLAAIGCGYNGDNWIAPINWTRPSTVPAIEGGRWAEIDRVEPVYPSPTPSTAGNAPTAIHDGTPDPTATPGGRGRDASGSGG